MDKRELIAVAARQCQLTRPQMREATEALFGTIAAALAAGDSIVLQDFGRFSTWRRRQQVRGFDGQRYQVEERQVVFKTSAELRRRLKEGGS